MKKIISISIILIIVIASYFYFNKKKNSKNTAQESISTLTLKKGTISKTVTATGTIEPNYIVEIKSKAGGEIINIPFDEGDIVKRDELLLELEPSNEERNLLNSQINVEAAKARVERTKSQLIIEKANIDKSFKNLIIDYNNMKYRKDDALSKLNRKIELFEKNILSQEELETAELTYINNEAQYKKIIADSEAFYSEFERLKIKESEIIDAEIALQKAEISLEDAQERFLETKIYSPLNGIIIRKYVSEGQIISSGISSVSDGTLLMTIADLSKLYITATVDESDIGNIKEGQKVDISFDAFYNKRYKGSISKIAPQSQTISNVTVFGIRIEILDKDISDLRVGMTANAIVNIAEKSDIFTIPLQAIRTRRQKPVVFVQENGEMRHIEIEQGITDGINIEIRSDELFEGMKIVLSQISRQENSGRSGRDVSRDMRRMMR